LPNWFARDGPCSGEISVTENRQDCLFATLVDYREFHPPFRNIHDGIRSVAQCEKVLLFSGFPHLCGNSDGFEIDLRIKRAVGLGFHVPSPRKC
jgi:hypothetical protein